ncbi:DUF1538 family protein [Rhodocyclaceae bacterium SMB388]
MGLALLVAPAAPWLAHGFGLIAFASIFPIVTVMLYALYAAGLTRSKGETS